MQPQRPLHQPCKGNTGKPAIPFSQEEQGEVVQAYNPPDYDVRVTLLGIYGQDAHPEATGGSEQLSEVTRWRTLVCTVLANPSKNGAAKMFESMVQHTNPLIREIDEEYDEDVAFKHKRSKMVLRKEED